MTPRLCRAPLGLQGQVALAAGQLVQGGRELDRAQLAAVAGDQLAEQVEDGGRQDVHPEEAEVMPRAEPGDLEPQLGDASGSASR